MESIPVFPKTVQTILLSCGVLAPLLYLFTDRLAGRLLKGYNFMAQSISDLSAAGSPTRSLVVSLTLVASLLLIAFGVGVWREASATWLVRLVAALLIGNAVAGTFAMLFFPNQYGVTPVFKSPGVMLMFLSVVFFMLAMVFGAFAFSGWLRILSITIPVSYVLLAIARFMFASNSSTGQSVVLVGAQERTMSYTYLVWVLFLAINLLLSARTVDPVSMMGG